MSGALIISSGENSVAYLTEILKQAAVNEISHTTTAAEAKQLLTEQEYDLYLVNMPSPGDSGEGLAKYIASKGVGEVILFVKADQYDEAAENLESQGILVVAKPVNRALFLNVIKVALAAHKKVQLMQDQNRKLMQKLEDIKVIDRAKCILISNLAMSEQEAHKYIEKHAMDMRVNKRVVADEILKTYEY